MINRQKADRSINQLLNCLMGARSKGSKHLEDHPAERIEFCFKQIKNEIQNIVENSEAHELSQALYVPRMHLDSLNSLKTLNQLIEEVQW
jgi:flagellar motor component MotA|tara:strand:+ start:250 stop:519 length:270 start_codon:yes stop_codon:yes gene_type:complete